MPGPHPCSIHGPPELIDLRRPTSHDHALRRKLVSGALLRLTPEIAVDAGRYRTLPPWERATVRARAFGMAADRAVLCSLSAARILGIPVLNWDDTVELGYLGSTSAPAKKHWPPRTAYRRSALSPAEVTVFTGVRVTTVERTLVDIARHHGVVEGVVAIDAALRRYADLTVRRLQAAGEHRKLHGIGKFRTAVQLADATSESPLESQARATIQLSGLAGISLVETQKEVVVRGGRYRVDLMLNGWLIVEVDGRVKYDGVSYGVAVDDVLIAERKREKSLQNAGFVVLRAEHRDLRPRPDGSCALLEWIAEALARRARSA